MLQVNGSPLPVITLLHPMQNGEENLEREDGTLDTSRGEWGFLACINAHRGSNRFGTYYAWLRDLGQFQRDYLDDPELALRKYFKYEGPDLETTVNSPKAHAVIEEDIFS